jgi:dihydropteroate synthase
MLWQTPKRTFDLSSQGLIMGILNVTADSFSDGGEFLNLEQAMAHAEQMANEGAQIIDVGGESTRPGAEPVPEAEEMRRVLPIIQRLAGDARFAISIDTMKPAVARAAMEAGAQIVNDVTGLRSAEMRAVVAETRAAAIAMHMQGTPRTMQLVPTYTDVVGEIRESFRQTFDTCIRSAIDPMCLAFDPGIGFGKTVEHNLALLRNLDSVGVEGRPLVLGVSRKSFLGRVLGSSEMEDREWPTVALTSYGRSRGARVFRVHNVKPNVEALRMTEAILNP